MNDFDQITASNPARRSLLRRAGAGSAMAAALAMAPGGLLGRGTADAATTSTPTDADILNFALNLEYLEAEFYLRAVTGTGLASTDITGTGAQGVVIGGGAVPFKTAAIYQYAKSIAIDEQAHVKFLRSALGSAAVARPGIDLVTSFNTAATAAGLITAGQTFNPFADENSFLLGAYIFEDVGVTAYHGAAPLITSKAYLAAAAGILAVEAYHAGSIRTLLFQNGSGPATVAISAARAALSGAQDDQGVIWNNQANITPTDQNALAFSRTTAQVLNIVYLGGAASGYGFFPAGVNGNIS